MNLVEEKQRGLIPPGLQSWPLQPIEYLTNTASVAPPPAGPAGCRPLYLLHLLNLSFTLWAPNRFNISSEKNEFGFNSIYDQLFKIICHLNALGSKFDLDVM